MSMELGAAEAVVREQAARAGLSPADYVLRLALEDSIRSHAAYSVAHPGAAELAAEEAECAQAEVDSR